MTESVPRLLCFGDSNTFGYIPGQGGRYADDARWPGVLQSNLNIDMDVLVDGLNGRTTGVDDPLFEGRNGLQSLKPALMVANPTHLIIMLGTNDLKARLSVSLLRIEENVSTLITIATDYGLNPGNILIVAPPHIETSLDLEMNANFKGAPEESKKLASIYRRVAIRANCRFFDAAEVCRVSDIDGLHLDEVGHKKLGKAISNNQISFTNKSI